MQSIQQVAILGAGVSGSQLAALFANCGFDVLLLDLAQELAESGLQQLAEARPPVFFTTSCRERIRAGNYQDHLPLLETSDWVIEAVSERLDVKKSLLNTVTHFLKPETLISTNTSGLSVQEIGRGLPPAFRDYFCGTHFFTPTRFRELVEVVPIEETLPEVLEKLDELCRHRLGKQVLFAADTPYFIANRIGVFALMAGIYRAAMLEIPVVLADRLTGMVLGGKDTGIFGMADTIGLDSLALMSLQIMETAPDDPSGEIFSIPSFMQTLITQNRTGRKARAGFYCYNNGNTRVLDLTTLDYVAGNVPESLSLQLAAEYHSIPGKLNELINFPDAAGQFVWEWLSDVLLYAAGCIPEVSRNIITIDRAMCWGFGWELGPFRLWDAIGLEKSLDRMKNGGKIIPEWLQAMLEVNCLQFYDWRSSEPVYFDTHYGEVQPLPLLPDTIYLSLLKEQRSIIKDNWGASLLDIGDGVLCVEFHSIAPVGVNPIDSATLDILEDSLDLLEGGAYCGLVLANEARDFSHGMSLPALIKLISGRRWDQLERRCRRYQEIAQRIAAAARPVVCAPHHYTSSAGLELALACDRRVVFSEYYCGFAEARLGLIPCGSGTLQLLKWFSRSPAGEAVDPLAAARQVLEYLLTPVFSYSALDARERRLLLPEDRIVTNRIRLTSEAKQVLLQRAGSHVPGEPVEMPVAGTGGRLVLEQEINHRVQAGEWDELCGTVATQAALVLTGGLDASAVTPLGEEYLLELERQAFLRLCGEESVLKRLEEVLEKGTLAGLLR